MSFFVKRTKCVVVLIITMASLFTQEGCVSRRASSLWHYELPKDSRFSFGGLVVPTNNSVVGLATRLTEDKEKTDCQLVSLSLNDGLVAWQLDLGRHEGSLFELLGSDDKIYVFMKNTEEVLIVEASTGRICGHVNFKSREVRDLQANGNVFYYLDESSSLVAYDFVDDLTIWTSRVNGHLIRVSGGQVLVFSKGGDFIVLNKESGERVNVLSKNNSAFSFDICGGILFINSQEGLTAFDLSENKVVWEKTLPPNVTLLNAGSDVVYCREDYSTLCAYSTIDGSFRWKICYDVVLYGVIDCGNVFYVHDMDGVRAVKKPR